MSKRALSPSRLTTDEPAAKKLRVGQDSEMYVEGAIAESPLQGTVLWPVFPFSDCLSVLIPVDLPMSEENNAEQFDENRSTKFMDLYSRQIGTYGVETMKNLVELKVLVIGLQGL
jgi:hypothetical protein